MANVSYRIGGKFDGKAINQAKSGLSSLGGVVSNLKGVFQGLAVAFSVKKIIDFTKESTQAFSVQQEAINKLSQAVQNNKNLTQNSLKSIVDYTGQLQSKSIYGDEVLQGQAAYLTAMGLEEKQIKNVLNAAVELSSAGVGSLDSNVRNLSKTLSGQKGELGELIPEMRNLTKEQLENGEAIDIVAKKYAGFAENLSQNSLSGVTAQVSNLFGDMKEKIGSISGTLKFEAFKKLIPILENINTWLDSNAGKITNIFLHLPDVALASFSLIKNIMKQVFTVEGIINYYKYIINITKNTFKVLFSIINAISVTLWEPLKTGFEWTSFGIKSLFITVTNFFYEKINSVFDFFAQKINWIIEKANVISTFLGGKEFSKLDNVIQIELKTAPEQPQKVNTTNIENAWKNIGTTLGDSVSNIVDSSSEFAKQFEKPIKEFKDSIGTIANKEIAFAENKTVVSNAENVAAASQTAEKSLGSLGSILSAFGEIGQVVFLILSSNPIGLIVMLIGKLVSALSEASPAFGKFINAISFIMQVVAETIAPIINQIFEPLVGILQIIGEIIGTALNPILEVVLMIVTPLIDAIQVILVAVAPFIKILAQILGLIMRLNPFIHIFTISFQFLAKTIEFLFNKIISPVVNFLVKMIAGVGNVFISIWNAIVGVLNGISIFGWHPFNLSYKSKINADNYSLQSVQSGQTNSGTSSGGSGKTGGSASYTAAKDVYVNIYFTNSYVNGDARQIALSIRDEIKSAERLGY